MKIVTRGFGVGQGGYIVTRGFLVVDGDGEITSDQITLNTAVTGNAKIDFAVSGDPDIGLAVTAKLTLH